MNDDVDLIMALLAVAIAALVLVVGELYIVNRPAELPATLVPQHQLDRAMRARSTPQRQTNERRLFLGRCYFLGLG